MEPTLTPSDPAGDPLETLLRAAPPAIPDHGFTARVCAALPPRKAVPPVTRRLVLSGALLLGCLLSSLAWSRLGVELPGTLMETVRGWNLEPWHALLIVIAFSAWAISQDTKEGAVIAGA
jgi:hypothetical protein